MASLADVPTPASIVLPTLALLALLLDLPPLIWHVRNRNVAACNLIAWTIFGNLCSFVNALIWPTDDVTNWFPGFVLCDIEVKLLNAGSFGIAGSLACIMRALANVLDTQRTTLVPSKGQRYKELLITGLLCFGGPLYVIVIHYVVQPNRYYIFAIAGCTASLDNSWPAIVLVVIWPTILCLVAVYYGVVVLFRMRKYKREFSAILTASTSNLTESRFLRLFLLSASLVLIFLPLQLYVLYRNTTVPLLPYSWRLVHGPEWMDIIMMPAHGVVPLDRWITVVLGIFVFLFFGLGTEATKMYRKWWAKLRLDPTSTPTYDHTSTEQPPHFEHKNGSFTLLFLGFCKRKLSSMGSLATMSEKDNTSTTVTSPTFPVDSEKCSHCGNPVSPPLPNASTQQSIDPSEDGSLPPLPERRDFTSIRDFVPQAPIHSRPDDIESAFQRHEEHQPNRFLRGLWHANNTGSPARIPAVHGLCLGTPNGLKF
ncbi:MAG: hypothetical protein Q9222_007223 [Ikaeria aurantiellina]